MNRHYYALAVSALEPVPLTLWGDVVQLAPGETLAVEWSPHNTSLVRVDLTGAPDACFGVSWLNRGDELGFAPPRGHFRSAIVPARVGVPLLFTLERFSGVTVDGS